MEQSKEILIIHHVANCYTVTKADDALVAWSLMSPQGTSFCHFPKATLCGEWGWRRLDVCTHVCVSRVLTQNPVNSVIEQKNKQKKPQNLISLYNK